MKKTIIGITGKIGAGKTSIVDHLTKIPGVHSLNADELATKLYSNSNIKSNLLRFVGSHDIATIRKILVDSQDATQLSDLANIFKPWIKIETEAWLESHESGVLLLDFPLLFEAGTNKICDVTIQVNADTHIRRKRLYDRNPATSEIFELIDASQYSEERRSNMADYTVTNNLSLRHAYTEAKRCIAQYIPTVGLYPGSFDPITLGHLDVITNAAPLFETLYVGIGINERKTPLFTIAERIAMIKKETNHLTNVEVISYKGLLVHAAKENDATYIIRGIRNAEDASNELELCGVNNQLDPSIKTIMIPTDPKYTYVSSTAAKVLNGHEVDISHLVSDNVAQLLKSRR